MKSARLLLLFLSVLPCLAIEPVTNPVNLLEVIKSGAAEYHLNPRADFHDDPKEVWTFLPDGMLKISGRGYGYVATKESFRDYHLVLEFKWGDKTWGKREKAAKDNGILLHAYGPHGAFSDTWMASIEAQIIEGGVGDILVLSPKLEDGIVLTTSLSAEFALDRDKEKIWKKGEPRQTVTAGRINWKQRDVDWVDKKGFRGRDDLESPAGEWNRLEVIARGDTLQYFVNGAMVNEAFDCKPAEGRILLQTEGAEMLVRRYELHPLDAFKEKWTAIQASGGSDVSVRDGQDTPLSPEESLKRIQLDGPYEAQLVAAEPLVLDPVECAWDAQGRLYVADMRDYPLGPPNPGDPWLSRIQLLTDEDGDGRMDKAVTFADHLDNVQGLLPYNNGLIATTRTQILFLKDTDGDGKADERKSLINGFNPKHSQLQVSAPRWGLDNQVYFNNGLDAKEIYGAEDGSKKLEDRSEKSGALSSILNPQPSDAVQVARSNFRWDPRTGKIEPTSGYGQYGGAFDDWGHQFFCSNRNPVMFAVMPYEAVMRNPQAGIEKGYEDIAPAGADTRVYPLKITHTTADAHAGTNTACSGLGVYRGHLMPELKNNVFVPDPTGQLITRYKIEPNGASLKATRVGEHTEFFRSSDEWCRPVNFTTGPDGAIYVCDMYRRWIDHARFFPEEFVKTHDMRQGENHGRIWRIVPVARHSKVESERSKTAANIPAKSGAGRLDIGMSSYKIEPAPNDIEGLVAWLGHENAWQRETAQRLLVEKATPERAEAIFQAIKTHATKGTATAPGRINYLWTIALLIDQLPEEKRVLTEKTILAPLIAEKDDPRIIENAIGLCSRGYANLINLNGLFRHTQTPASSLSEHPDDRVLMQYLCYHLTRFDDIDDSLADQLASLEPRMGDRWIQRAIASTYGLSLPGSGLHAMFYDQEFERHLSPQTEELVRTLARCASSDGNRKVQFENALHAFDLRAGQLTWWKPALLQGLAEGLPKSGGKLGGKSLAEFVAKPPAGFEAAAKEIGVLLKLMDATLSDSTAPDELRLACLPLLAQRRWEEAHPVLRELLSPGQPAALQTAALGLLKRFGADKASLLVYELLPTAGPTVRRELVALLTANPKTALDLFKRMEKGEFSPALVDIETRWRYQRGTGEMRDLAVKLFGQASEDRAAVIAQYLDSMKIMGDAKKGQAVFATLCITCHKHGQLGVDVGPPLSDVKVKPPEALLSDILDPNRMFEARWSAYQIDTKEGRILSGLITSENSDSVTLTMMGGVKESIQRSAIKEMKSLDRSLMPPGLEAAITKEQMADLLAFLLGR